MKFNKFCFSIDYIYRHVHLHALSIASRIDCVQLNEIRKKCCQNIRQNKEYEQIFLMQIMMKCPTIFCVYLCV